MITCKGCVDSAQEFIQDNSTPMRDKLVKFFNQYLTELRTERDWECLKKNVDIVAASAQITKPADFERFVYATDNDSFFLLPKDRVSAEDAFKMPDDVFAVGPYGFTEEDTTITFHPWVEDDTTVSLRYVVKFPAAFVYDDTPSLFPARFSELVVRAIMTKYYEYDKDQNASLSYKIQDRLLSNMKEWDNLQKPRPRNSKYMRTSR